LEDLRAAVLEAAAEIAVDGVAPAGTRLERPRRAGFGDYSTNAALLLAPALGRPPREVAEHLGAACAQRLGAELERFEVAGPGFVNLFLADAWYRRALAGLLAAGAEYGGGGAQPAERVLVEFVSANPTGPMHVGHARNAAYGDALARLLALHGHAVTREFYVNDAGAQVRKLGESIGALARGEAVPEDGYHGDYVGPLAEQIEGAAELDADALGRAAVAIMVERMAHTLAKFRVRFDAWMYESELHAGEPSAVTRALELLAERGYAYRREKATWLRSTEFGDDKDRVLVRSGGEYTYFASDIAYHQDKRRRGYERQIDVWGADHHGYVERVRAAYAALGGDPQELELLTMQLVHLVRRGERAQMSKRAGEFVTLEDLVSEIGVDAARWFLLSRSHDTTIDLDLDAAREQSSENPVYYVQYAHARIASMLAKVGEQSVATALADVAGEAARLALAGAAAPLRDAEAEPLHVAETALVRRLVAFPEEVAEAAARRAPHRIAAYALELAQDFTAFYRDCRVVGAEPPALESWRLALCVAAQRTIARCLTDLLGVSAPQEM
jgi:arginyl-tRNA synthetase